MVYKTTKEWLDRDGKRYDINTPIVRAVSGFKRRYNKDLRATKKQIDEQKRKMHEDGYRLVAGSIRGKYATISGKKCKKYREMKKALEKQQKPYPKRDVMEN